MISVQAAEEIINRVVESFGATTKNVLADRDYPPMDRVMMDGIALNFEAYRTGHRKFKILDVVGAGVAAPELKDKSAAYEIMTGAVLPIGCNVVVPYEWLEIENSFATIVSSKDLKKFDHIHLKASDCHKDQLILPAGESLSGPISGIISSFGIASKELNLQPKILIISTGDELVDVHDVVLPHQLRRSNVYALKTSLMLHGYFDVETTHLKDDPESIKKHFNIATHKYDLLIYSGGVSKGKFDYLPQIWIECGVEKFIHGVAQKPGKPLWFGKDCKNQTLIFGLPGNPVSSLVCLHRFLLSKKKLKVKLATEVENKLNLTYYLPVKILSNNNAELIATLLKMKNSGEFIALAGSDGFIELGPMTKYNAEDGIVNFFPWRSLC